MEPETFKFTLWQPVERTVFPCLRLKKIIAEIASDLRPNATRKGVPTELLLDVDITRDTGKRETVVKHWDFYRDTTYNKPRIQDSSGVGPTIFLPCERIIRADETVLESIKKLFRI